MAKNAHKVQLFIFYFKMSPVVIQTITLFISVFDGWQIIYKAIYVKKNTWTYIAKKTHIKAIFKLNIVDGPPHLPPMDNITRHDFLKRYNLENYQKKVCVKIFITLRVMAP